MKSFICLDDKNKKLTRLNRNYFFAVTAFIVFLNILLYESKWLRSTDISVIPQWGRFSLNNLFQTLLNSYRHANRQHTLLNMLCFFVAGLYVERKQGSLKFLAFIIIFSFFTAFATCANYLSLSWVGFSGVNYGLYGYIITDFIFTVGRKRTRYKFNTVSGAVVLALIYLAMCFNGGTATVSFTVYPYDLLTNLGHASGFFAWLLFGAYEQVCNIIQQTKEGN